MRIKLALALWLGLIAPGLSAETITNWGLKTGADPRGLCVYDVGVSPKTCNQIGRVNATTHFAELSTPGAPKNCQGCGFQLDFPTAVNRLNDRLFVGGATAYTSSTSPLDWFTLFQRSRGLGEYTNTAQTIFETDGVNANSGGAGLFATESLPALSGGSAYYGLTAFGINNSAFDTPLWTIYAESTRNNATTGVTYSAELETINFGNSVTTDPYAFYQPGMTIGIDIGTGAYTTAGQANASTALFIGGELSGSGTIQWNAGLQINYTAIAVVAPDSRKHAIQLPVDNDITWYSAAATVAGHLTIDTGGIMQAVAANGLNINGCTLGTSVHSILCQSVTSGLPQMTAYNLTNDTSSASFVLVKSRGASGAVVNGDDLGFIRSSGYANGGLRDAAAINFKVKGAPSGSNIPSGIRLFTTNAAGNLAFFEFDQAMHFNLYAVGQPVITACGGAGLSAARGNDMGGEVTEGAGATGCVISFFTAYITAPYCTVAHQGALTNFTYSIGTAAITVVHDAGATKLNWTCVGDA
jgi:hypothetical protein